MNSHWVNDAVFYHIFPLGFCGVARENQGNLAQTGNCLRKIETWLDSLADLGVNAIFLGPLFESSSHGYDTADYFWVDKRLGTNDDLVHLSDEIHRRGMKLILDGVFNHVGRRFWAFRSVLAEKQQSPYLNWFVDVRFHEGNSNWDGIEYACWEGHTSLPKLNLANPAVSGHLLDAVGFWMDTFHIDGLRLDAADCVSPAFWKQLHDFTRARRSDFWLMGEIIHGDYRKWANPELLDSVTNYEAYKGLWSSLNDHNYWEIAYSLNRQFGTEGLYRGLVLYNFLDNHDVSRIMSQITDPSHVYLAYLLLMTMPGTPSLYYGSELGWRGQKTEGDWKLRPEAPWGDQLGDTLNKAPLRDAIKTFLDLRQKYPVLRYGDYQQCYVNNEQFGFLRYSGSETMMVLLNMADVETCVIPEIPVSLYNRHMEDVLNHHDSDVLVPGKSISIPAKWGRVIRIR